LATAQNIVDRVKWQCDTLTDGSIVDADILPFVNLAYREAWDMCVASGEKYFVKVHTPGTFTLTGGVSGNSFQITATDFFKVFGVQMLAGNRWSDPLPTFEFNEWEQSRDGLGYIHLDDSLYFEPNESLSGKTFRLWYVYKPADLALGTTFVDPLNGAVEQYMIDTCAIRATHRAEEDASALLALQKGLQDRIAKMAANRNAGKGRRVARTRGGRRFRFMTRSGIPLP